MVDIVNMVYIAVFLPDLVYDVNQVANVNHINQAP
jgi:hypothetical protein